MFVVSEKESIEKPETPNNNVCCSLFATLLFNLNG